MSDLGGNPEYWLSCVADHLKKGKDVSDVKCHMSRLVGKPTMWFPNRSDTNRPVQSQKRARNLKF